MEPFLAGTGVAAAVGVGIAVAATAPFSIPVVLGIAGGAIAIGLLVSYFARKPEQENETMREIYARLKLQEEMEKAKKEREEKEKELKVEKERLEQMAEESRRKAEEKQEVLRQAARELLEMKKRLRQEARTVEMTSQRNQALEEQRRAAESSRLLQEETEMAARLEEQQRNIDKREQELQEYVNQAQRRIEEEQARAASGIQSIQWPTEAEFYAAREKVRYSPLNFHFAIVGKAGCGKSSLINAFLNLKPEEDGAAKTGITETTLEIGRYPDPGRQPPRPWTVWFDVPGAGTQRISHWHYFTKQALFVFDIIILAIGDRFEETDCQIVRSCKEFKIPCFIVRSKADQHITNMIHDLDDDYSGPFDRGHIFEQCRQRFIEQTQRMVTEELERAGLMNQKVYCVSNRNLRKTYNNSLNGMIIPSNLLDEMQLVEQLMISAYQRRCSDDKALDINPESSRLERSVGWAKAAYTAVKDSVEQKMGVSESLDEDSGNGCNKSWRTGGGKQKRQTDSTWGKRVLYLRHETSSNELETELEMHNPGLRPMLAAPLRMMSKKVALLFFRPGIDIPRQVSAFGGTIEFAMYKEKPAATRRPTNSNRPPTSETVGSGGASNSGASDSSWRGGYGGRGGRGECGRGGRGGYSRRA